MSDFVSLRRLQTFLGKVTDLINQKADKQQIVSAVMSASSWNNSKYSFETAYPSSQYDISISLRDTCTMAQLEAFGEAKLAGSSSTNIVTAKGTVPTINIPIIIKVVTK